MPMAQPAQLKAQKFLSELLPKLEAPRHGPCFGGGFFMHVDLLTNPINCAFAVNVELSEEEATCGALYITRDLPGPEIPMFSGEYSVTLVVPEELVKRPEPFRAWNIKLQIKDENHG